MKGVAQDGSGTPGSASTAASDGGKGSGTGAGGGGWSEVARKGPAGGAKEEANSAAFKVVAAKRKGKR